MNFFELYLADEDLENEDKKEEEEPKIINKVFGCDIEKCFIGTNKYTFKQDDELIKDINNERTKEMKRIFYKENGIVGYIEVFQNPELLFANEFSNKISFLFEYVDDEKIIYDQTKCLGFRYYNSKNEYCTLLKIGNNDIDDYQFLEKIENIPNPFYDKELDCFSIVYESIFSKYEKKKSFFKQIMQEGPLYEILGFSHAILFKSNKFYKFHKPHTIDIKDIKDFTSPITPGKDDDVLNIQPILFNGHISILFYVDKVAKRGFILSDPSHFHSKRVEKQSYIDGFIFPKNMRKMMQLYPPKKIQKFNSCFLWFYFQMLILINYNTNLQKEYKTSKDVIKSILNMDIYFECVNYYQNIFGLDKNLVEINPKSNLSDNDFIYSMPKEEIFGLEKVRINIHGFLNQFVDLIHIIEIKTGQDLSYKFGFEETGILQNYLEDFNDFIILLNYNLNFFYLNNFKDDKSIFIKFIQSTIQKMNALKENFISDCLDYFANLVKNKYDIYNDIDDDIDRKQLRSLLAKKRKIYKSAQDYYRQYENLKESTENKVKLYPLYITSKILFPFVGILYNSK